jgi:hypothetical protein
VFDRAVRRVFDDEDWFIADFKQERPDHRPDFLAMRDGIWLRVASRVALTCDSATNRREGQIIPTNTYASQDLKTDPKVVHRGDLSGVLADIASAARES